MQQFLVRAAMVGCLRAQRGRARRLDEPIVSKAEAANRSGDEDESAREGEGVLLARRVVLPLADSDDS